MHWVEVDEYRLPKQVGGHPALEFCNTWAGWNRPAGWTAPIEGPDPREWLPGYDQFAVWSGYTRLLTPDAVRRIRREAEQSPRPAAAVLRRVQRLREPLYRLMLDPADQKAFDEFSRVAQTAVRSTVLESGPDGLVCRVLPEALGLALPLFAVALSAEQLLADPVRHSVRACPGEDCGWLFLDKRGRRRWCDMAVCGNRAKVRAHAARRRG